MLYAERIDMWNHVEVESSVLHQQSYLSMTLRYIGPNMGMIRSKDPVNPGPGGQRTVKHKNHPDVYAGFPFSHSLPKPSSMVQNGTYVHWGG